MKRVNIGLLFLTSILAVLLGTTIFLPKQNIKKAIKKPKVTVNHTIEGFNENLFKKGIIEAEGSKYSNEIPFAVGIVPHHDIAGVMIAKYFDFLAQQNPKRIIIVGPNHREVGSSEITTSVTDWDTNNGVLVSDKEFIKNMQSMGLVRVEDIVLNGEQSISTLVPYIKYYLAETKIIPIVLKNKVDVARLNKLAEYFSTYIDSTTVLIASVDFSHYLPFDQARINDEITIQLIKNRDIDKIITLDSDFMDSPSSIALVLKIANLMGLKNTKVLEYSNSSHLSGGDGRSTTGYFSIIIE